MMDEFSMPDMVKQHRQLNRLIKAAATSELALSTLAQVLVVEVGCWRCCCSRWHHGCECWPSDNCEEV
jgi:hypothetical protein